MSTADDALPLDTPAAQARRRRTFAIISHPDAGKTTLTEHLLLLGGAIHAAGRVKARGEARDPLELLDELADQLQIECAPMVWPVGMGQNFRGTIDLYSEKSSWPGVSSRLNVQLL